MESKVVLKEKNPHDTANVFSKIFLTWSFRLFRTKNGPSMSDLWQARQGDESSRLGDSLEQAWETELENQRQFGSKPSLTKAIVRAFWFEYMMWGVAVGIMFVILWPTIPYTLAIFIEYFSQEKTPETYRKAHIFNFLMNMCSIMTALMFCHTQVGQGRVGMRVRVACCSLMYRKILKLDRLGLSKTEPGQVVNLMSNDVSRFDLASTYLNYLWAMPLVTIVISSLIWQHIGVATVAALVVIFLQTLFVQGYLSKVQGTYRGKIAIRTDERVKVMSELVNGVQVIKMYAWEKPFEILVDRLRKLEVSFIMKTSMVKGFTVALGVFTERFILFVAIATFVIIGGDIRADTTFALVQYFNLMQLACNIQFPVGLAFLAEALVSVRRIEEFLLLDEKETKSVKTKAMKAESKPLLSEMDEKENNINDGSNPSELLILGVSASWSQDSVVDSLRNITLTAKPGEFVGVAGLVGSGKSSLLQLVLGELKPKQGTVSLGGSRISYASQEPWLFVATVRENILFGLPYDRVRYKKVVKACALLKDFELLPHGDSTLVGERGVSLSGGQRARISLARACYRQADIYLLDDPLSAVDTHVGKHLVSECILGLLSGTTRILVTHQLHHLKDADKIVILRHGEIETQGLFEEVSTTPMFVELLQEVQSNEEVEETPALSRENSLQSRRTSTAADTEKLDVSPKVQAEVAEMSGSGRVPLSVYIKYFTAGNGCCLLTTMVLSVIIGQLITSACDLWLTHWMNNVEARYKYDVPNNISSLVRSNDTEVSNITEYAVTDSSVDTANTTTTLSPAETNLTAFVTTNAHRADDMYYVYVWAITIFGCIILTSVRSFMFLWTCMRSSIKLHNQMFKNIMSATMRFFDTNPSGRILNRFSKDMGMVDEVLPRLALDCITIVVLMLGIIGMVALVNPYMLLTTAGCAVATYFWTAMYLRTAQGLKRLEGVTRSPVFSHVTTTMAGLNTVRACDAQQMLIKHFDEKQDIHTATWYLTIISTYTFAIWLSMICSIYVLVVAYAFLFLDDAKSGNVGLAISQALILVNMVQYGIKQGAEVVSQMTSVERIIEFTSLPQEKKGGSSPPDDWPQKGRVVFKNLSLRYTGEGDSVLKNLNIEVESGWKVGVVGRTGAGKSSLISALFRLAPIQGNILIDDVDTESLTLRGLRSKISIIPQEPVLFSASLRYNVDPFEEYSDADIWQALEQVELKSAVKSLSAPVASGGSNFSAGERQLLCLARAALAHNKLLVLDEATANVDPTTDALIQKSIRKNFADCTVITVAHRLHTVADSDRVIVMGAGQVLESGHPHELLQNEGGHFSSMVKELGAASESSLREIASNAYSVHVAKKKTSDSA